MQISIECFCVIKQGVLENRQTKWGFSSAMFDYHRVSITFYRSIRQFLPEIDRNADQDIAFWSCRCQSLIAQESFPYKVLPNYQATFIAGHRSNVVLWSPTIGSIWLVTVWERWGFGFMIAGLFQKNGGHQGRWELRCRCLQCCLGPSACGAIGEWA